MNRRRKHSKERSTKSDKDRAGLLKILVGAAVMVAVFGSAHFLRQANRVDDATLCPISGATAHTIILIDKSDAWDTDDTERVRRLLTDIYQEVPAGSRLTIQAILGDLAEGQLRESTEVRTMFDKCNPGSAEECQGIIESCGVVTRRYEQSFESQLQSVIEQLETPGTSSFSPLFETYVQLIDDSNADVITVHLISDLMENSSGFRFYEVVPLAEDLIRYYPIQSDAIIKTVVHVQERRRHSPELLRAVTRVWTEYLSEQDVKVTFERLLIAD